MDNVCEIKNTIENIDQEIGGDYEKLLGKKAINEIKNAKLNKPNEQFTANVSFTALGITCLTTVVTIITGLILNESYIKYIVRNDIELISKTNQWILGTALMLDVLLALILIGIVVADLVNRKRYRNQIKGIIEERIAVDYLFEKYKMQSEYHISIKGKITKKERKKGNEK